MRVYFELREYTHLCVSQFKVFVTCASNITFQRHLCVASAIDGPSLKSISKYRKHKGSHKSHVSVSVNSTILLDFVKMCHGVLRHTYTSIYFRDIAVIVAYL